MATTISTDSPKLTADVASRAEVYGGRGLVFDGVSDYLTTPNITTSATSTYSFWINLNSISGTQDLFTHANIYFRAIDNELYVYSSFPNHARYDNVLVTGSWNHIAWVANGSTHKVYINGEELTPDATTSTAIAVATNVINIGSGGNPFSASMADFKYYHSALSESDITSQYLKPESVPSPSTLVAWYPMSEANPESPQSIVYDHSEKKLDTNLVTNSTFDSDITGWSLNSADDDVSISQATVDGKICLDINDQSSNRKNAQFDLGDNAVDGELYKISYYVRKAQTGSTSKDFIVGLGFSNVGGDAGNVDKTVAEYDTWEFQEIYIICGTSNNNVQFLPTAYDNSATGRLFLDDVKVQKVLMGNHATTNFFGDELITNGDFASDANWTKGDGWSIGSGVATSDDSAQSATSYLKSASFTALSTSKTYRLSYTVVRNAGTVDFIGMGGSDSQLNNRTASGTYSQDFVPSGANTQIWVVSVDGGFDGTVDNISLKEVGISSTGFTTAQNEPVIPQIPLVKSNEKMLFGANHLLNQYVSTGQAFNFGQKVTISVWLIPNEIISESRTGIIGGSYYTDGDFHLGLHTSTRSIIFTPKAGTGGLWSLSADQWDIGKLIHLCLVYDTSEQGDSGRDSNKLYVNGILQNTGTGTGNTEDLVTTGLNIGHTNQYEYDGFLDEASIFNTAFDSTQVQELFNDGVALDATTHSKADDHLLGYWRNDGVTTWADRKKEQWMMLNGTDTEIELSTFTQSSSSIRTAIAWVYTDSSSLMSIFSGSTANLDNDLTSGFTRWYTGTSGWLQGTIDVRGAWTMVTYQFEPNGSDMDFKTYVNDTLDINLTLTSNYTTGTIKRLGYKSGQGRFFDGAIAQAGSVVSALTQAQITEIFNLGRKGNWLTTGHDWEFYYNGSNYATGTDNIEDASTSTTRDATITNGSISGSNDGSVQGTPDSITIREGLNSNKDGLGFPLTNPSSNVVRLNGVNEYVDVNVFNGLIKRQDIEAFGESFFAWIKLDNVSGTKYIVCHGRVITEDNAVYGGIYVESATAKFRLYKNSTYQTVSGTSTLSANTWYHIVGTYDGESNDDKMRIYIDGELEATSSALGGDFYTGEPTIAHVGRNVNTLAGNKDYYFDGLLDEVKIYNRALSLAEINKNYKHGKGKHKND